MHLLSVDHFQSSKLEWGNIQCITACYLLKKNAVMYCILPPEIQIFDSPILILMTGNGQEVHS
jgi:hypothetical protein